MIVQFYLLRERSKSSAKALKASNIELDRDNEESGTISTTLNILRDFVSKRSVSVIKIEESADRLIVMAKEDQTEVQTEVSGCDDESFTCDVIEEESTDVFDEMVEEHLTVETADDFTVPNDIPAAGTAKQMKPDCGESCRRKCATKFSNSDRQKLFHQFHSMENIVKQRKFISERIESEAPKCLKSAPGTKSRSCQLVYFLDAGHQRTQVCKTMFKNTLCISSNFIDRMMKKRNEEVDFSDLRGKYPRKLSQAQEVANRHIARFHGERKISKAEIYQNYYDECKRLQIVPVTSRSYREAFIKSSAKPAKLLDCKFCQQYENRSFSDVDPSFDVHIQANSKCRERINKRLRSRKRRERLKAEKIKF